MVAAVDAGIVVLLITAMVLRAWIMNRLASRAARLRAAGAPQVGLGCALRVGRATELGFRDANRPLSCSMAVAP